MFQMTFAIITPALVIGGYAERMRFSAVLWFSALWLLLVYVPVAHWVWGGGWLAQRGVMDFAGGMVVHVNAGVAALVCALVIGKRRGFPHVPHAAAQHAADGDRRGHAVGGLVRLQRRQRAGGQRPRRHGDAGHAPGRGGRRAGLDAGGVAPLRKAQRARHRHRHGGGPRHHHAGLRFRRPGGRGRHRLHRRHRVLLRHAAAEARAATSTIRWTSRPCTAWVA